MNKIFKYIIGFTLIFPLLILFYACMESSNHKQQYAKDTERVTKLVEALENDTTNIKPNITLEEALKLVSEDSELSSVKKEIQHLKDTYKTDYENKFSDLSNRVFKVASKLNTQIEKIKEEEKEKVKYKVKNIDNLKEEEITKCPTCGVLSHKSEIKENLKNRKIVPETFFKNKKLKMV